MKAIDYEEITVTVAAAIGLTASKIDAIADKPQVLARIIVNAFPVAWNEHGATPTSATKQQMPPYGVIELDSIADMGNFRAIGIGGTAYLTVTYFI